MYQKQQKEGLIFVLSDTFWRGKLKSSKKNSWMKNFVILYLKSYNKQFLPWRVKCPLFRRIVYYLTPCILVLKYYSQNHFMFFSCSESDIEKMENQQQQGVVMLCRPHIKWERGWRWWWWWPRCCSSPDICISKRIDWRMSKSSITLLFILLILSQYFIVPILGIMKTTLGAILINVI